MIEFVWAEENAFDVQNIVYAYDGGDPALSGISLCIRPGERVAVLGANGSGKSTLLKLLDGLYFPSSGTIKAFGRPLTERSLRDDAFNFAFRRRVGLVFQDSDVQLFCPSVWDEVAFAPLQLGLDRAEVVERVDGALRALRIEKLRDRPPHRLSGGEKKRVALASVLSLDPDVWLLDEPTAGLDPRSQAWLVAFLAGQAEAGKTIIIATHDLAVVPALADRACLLGEDHRLAADGRVSAVLADRSLLRQCNLLYEDAHLILGAPALVPCPDPAR
jgi:cobalt/nickel transport system ATP-binding protein